MNANLLSRSFTALSGLDHDAQVKWREMSIEEQYYAMTRWAAMTQQMDEERLEKAREEETRRARS